MEASGGHVVECNKTTEEIHSIGLHSDNIVSSKFLGDMAIQFVMKRQH